MFHNVLVYNRYIKEGKGKGGKEERSQSVAIFFRRKRNSHAKRTCAIFTTFFLHYRRESPIFFLHFKSILKGERHRLADLFHFIHGEQHVIVVRQNGSAQRTRHWVRSPPLPACLPGHRRHRRPSRQGTGSCARSPRRSRRV